MLAPVQPWPPPPPSAAHLPSAARTTKRSPTETTESSSPQLYPITQLNTIKRNRLPTKGVSGISTWSPPRPRLQLMLSTQSQWELWPSRPQGPQFITPSQPPMEAWLLTMSGQLWILAMDTLMLTIQFTVMLPTRQEPPWSLAGIRQAPLLPTCRSSPTTQLGTRLEPVTWTMPMATLSPLAMAMSWFPPISTLLTTTLDQARDTSVDSPRTNGFNS